MAEKVAKITISIPADLLGDIDGLATGSGESRSFVIREAAALYLRSRREADAAAARRQGVDRAMEVMQEIRSMPVLDDRSSLEILRELRDDDGLPKLTSGALRADEGPDE